MAGEGGQQWQERRTPGRFVCLCPARKDDRENLVAMLENPATELRPPVGQPTQVAPAGEQQVGLLLGLRQLCEHAQDLAISGHAIRQLLVECRAATRLMGGEPRVKTRELIERIRSHCPMMNIDAAGARPTPVGGWWSGQSRSSCLITLAASLEGSPGGTVIAHNGSTAKMLAIGHDPVGIYTPPNSMVSRS